MQAVEKYFSLEQRGSHFSKECFAGLSAFFSMAYCIFLAPLLLAKTGMPFTSLVMAVCIIGFFANVVQGLWTKLPIGFGPSVSLLLFVVDDLVHRKHFLWQEALALTFAAHLILLIFNRFGIRQWIDKQIPEDIKTSITAGIAALITWVGIRLSKLVIMEHHHILLQPEHITLWILGLSLILLLRKRLPSTVLIATLFLLTLLQMAWNGHLPQHIFQVPIWPKTWLLIRFPTHHTLSRIIMGITAIFVINLMDCTATITALCSAANIRGSHTRLRKNRCMDLLATTGMANSCLGLTPFNVYFESVAGISVGGATGLTAVILGLCFGLCLFFSPLIAIVPHAAVGACLCYTSGRSCIKSLKTLPWRQTEKILPWVLTIAGIPLFSIPAGIGIGILSYTLMQVRSKQLKFSSGLCILSWVYLLYFALLLSGL
jgi:adenine/guanine/hypoxanthine permease